MTDDRTVRMDGQGTVDPDDLGWERVRKQPVVVEATPMPASFEVETMEGTMEGDAGDVLIRGVEGELYPCDSDVFAQTYEDVDDPGPTANRDPTYLDSQTCDWHADPTDKSTHCGASPAAYVGEIHYACEEHFTDFAEWIETPSPIVHLSDGPRLILADGSVVYPIVTDGDGTELAFRGYDQGESVFGVTGDATPSVAFVDDPDAADHDAVQQRLRSLGVDDD